MIFNLNLSLIFDPLEQFDIVLFAVPSVSNLVLFVFSILLFMHFSFKINDTFLLQNKNIIMLEAFNSVKAILEDNLHIKQFFVFFYVCFIFIFIFLCNIIGMIPYSFTVTSSLIVTFFMAAMFFGGSNIIGLFTHGWKMLHLFMPSGVPLAILPFLVLIEVMSYFSKVISLSVRLFANMMSGHTLLKILLTFFWISLKNLVTIVPFLEFFIELLPWIIIILVTALEFAIAYLQAYVFTVLVVIYLNDNINLH